MLKVGLTGGIASGKSAVADAFAALGAAIIDTDAVAREVVCPGTPALAAIEREFGAEMIAASGELDRSRLRGLVFADADARRRLERIVHPAIRTRTLELIDSTEADYVLIAVPLLVETGFGQFVDRVLVVDCPEEIQLARLMQRDGVSENEARAALAAQTDRMTRNAAADDIIDNSGSLAALKAQVEALHARYLELALNCPQAEGRAE